MPSELPELLLEQDGTDRATARPLNRSWLAWGLALALLAVAAFVFGADSRLPQSAGVVARIVLPPAAPAIAPNLVKPITPAAAFDENMARPVDQGPIEAQRPFAFPAGTLAVSNLKALDCLTAAIYFEAASEGAQGQRAVAQVVLNRVRSPAYPHSVCGVVYQGSERTTGCQFTFTCDGSLNRIPSRSSWELARKIGDAALHGNVEPSVGTATHYHTVFVVPYWAASLDKIATVGQHVFYRFPGFWGKRAAFTGAYAGESAIIESDPLSAAQAVVSEALKDLAAPPSSGLAGPPTGTLVAPAAGNLALPAENAPLSADENRGQLIVPGDSTLPKLPDSKPKAP